MSPTANANYHRDWAQNKTKSPEPSFPVSYVPVHQCLQGSLGLLATQEAQLKENWLDKECSSQKATYTARTEFCMTFTVQKGKRVQNTHMKVRENSFAEKTI